MDYYLILIAKYNIRGAKMKKINQSPETKINEELKTDSLISRLISSLSDFFDSIVRKFMPDPFIFAILLTVLTLLLGVFVERKTPAQMINYWGEGFWGLLTFAMQMVIVLITGYVLAQAPLIQRFLDRVASSVHTPRGAVILATLVGGLGSYINWGFGLIVGSIIARKLAERIPTLHYPLVIAAAYSGFMFYGLGLSATIPLLISTKGHFLEDSMGIIPISETIFSPFSIAIFFILIVSLPIVNGMIKPKGKIIGVGHNDIQDHVKKTTKIETQTPAEKMERSKIIAFLAVAIGLVFVIQYFAIQKGSLDINIINFIMLFLGLVLHGSPRNYLNAVNLASKNVGGMIIQFPFYAGIMGMMDGSGLVSTISAGFVAISSPETLPFWGLLSSMAINFFTPSAGGHWAVQGPFMIEAANAMGADLGKVATSVQWGNAWQDIIQPMWLLPALAISGLRIRDIMGYNVIAFLWVGLVLGIGVLIWGFI